MRSPSTASALAAWLAAVWLAQTGPATAQSASAEPAAAQPASAEPAGVARASADLPRLPHSDASVAIDGLLDDAIWKEALVVDLVVETSPGENVPSPVETHAYLVEDGSRLLIAFDARDPEPDKIRAYLRDRDSAFNDDFVGIVIDSFNDARYGYEFFVNPLGVQMDLTQDDVVGNEDDSWDAIWDSAGRIGDQGFTVEIAIPLSQLRFARTTGDRVWGLDVLRFYPRSMRHRISNNMLERGRNCYMCQFQKFSGLAGVEASKNLEMVPSLTSSRTDARASPQGPLVHGDSETEVGLNVRWAVTQNLTANLALNPDFSQVEADVAQLNVNNQFALQFPESRPFFLEGASYFSTPIQAVFTRTVADPDLGAKLTGQPGDNAFGTFAAKDAVTNLLFPGPLTSQQTSLDESNDTVVGHFSRSVLDNSQVGALVTMRHGDDYRNDVAGFDGRLRITGQHSLRFQVLHSETEYPEATATRFSQPLGAFEGDAAMLRYNYSSREWYADLRYRYYEPGFRADSGFVARVDMKQTQLESGHTWQRGEQRWSQIQVGLNGTTTENMAGKLLDRNLQPYVSFSGPMQSYIQVGGGPNKRFWNGVLYEGNGMFLFSQLRPRGGINLSISINKGDQVDFANSRLAEELRVQPNIDWNVNQHLLLRLRQTTSRLDSKDGQKIFDADLTDFRATWQFNVRSFLRFSVQRQLVERNVPLFVAANVNEKTLTVASQLLYSYKLNPQTVLYLGYSDNSFEDDRLDDLSRTSRTFFAKFSYAWLH
ncbi:MAG TPA: DUF5916 domain-containing protein [Gammaproteobacteria bacterium]|nr:DUF5916 domain-containing protein [Gammaproteobacteria bacterium]